MVNTNIIDDIFYIELNRPDKSNSYDFAMALEMKNAFTAASKSNALAVVISAAGKNFCSGADLSWLGEKSDMAILKDMYKSLLTINVPVLTKVQGAVRGGGVGLVACSDIVLCDENVTFSLSEAKWGLIPGVITPMVIEKIGTSQFLELSLSARIFNFAEALSMNLVHHKIIKFDFILASVKENSTASTRLIKKMVREDFIVKYDLDKMLKLSSEIRSVSNFSERITKLIKS